MLYVTTREDPDIYTPCHAIRNTHGKDGGLFVPFHLPAFHQTEFPQKPEPDFFGCIREVFEYFFSSGKNLMPASGAAPQDVPMLALGQKIIAAKISHKTVSACAEAVCACDKPGVAEQPTNWLSIALWTGIYHGILCNLRSEGSLPEGQRLDISVSGANFPAIMGAWYARDMGLSVGRIICSDNADFPLWELLRHGHTKGNPRMLPEGMERLVYAAGGQEEVTRFLNACLKGTVFQASDRLVHALQERMYASVVSPFRMESTLLNLRKTEFPFTPSGALAFAGLQDYRSVCGKRELTLVLSE